MAGLVVGYALDDGTVVPCEADPGGPVTLFSVGAGGQVRVSGCSSPSSRATCSARCFQRVAAGSRRPAAAG